MCRLQLNQLCFKNHILEAKMDENKRSLHSLQEGKENLTNQAFEMKGINKDRERKKNFKCRIKKSMKSKVECFKSLIND